MEKNVDREIRSQSKMRRKVSLPVLFLEDEREV